MTFLKENSDTEPFSKNNEKKNSESMQQKKTPLWRREYCIQACAWSLLTIGLCIIVITFYLAIQQKHHNDDNNGYFESNGNEKIYLNEDNIIISFGNSTRQSDSGEQWMDDAESGNGRALVLDIFGVLTGNLAGCQEKLCNIACSHDRSIYTSLFLTMKASSCPSIDILLMESQDFPDDLLKNSWLPSNLTIHEVIIRSNNLTTIKSNAFNTRIFQNTFLMSWSNMNLQTVESGALLGMYKLKYLTIDCNIGKLESAFFQPVQTTLTHLKLNGNLVLGGNRNIFGVNYMTKLEYLDLSHNHINGSLSAKIFGSTPNLKYLVMIEAKVQHIQQNAFDELANKLIFVNLAKNLLTTLDAKAIAPILQNNVAAMINLSRNKLRCNCSLEELANLYKTYRNQFMDAVYCVAPHNMYGVSIEEVNYSEQCDVASSTTIHASMEESIDVSETPFKTSSTLIFSMTPPLDFDSSDVLNSEEEEDSSTELTTFTMRCANKDSVPSLLSSSSSSSSSSSTSSRSTENLERNVDASTDDMDYFKFSPPQHEFDLELIAENNSVIISVENPSDLMIIWFSEQQEAESINYNDMTLDYECMRYTQPSLIVGPLIENTTYTFCLLPQYQDAISPFNCLPLHVPIKKSQDVWISQENKQFTIGMLCLIFLLSTIMGALVAYFGIKTYPDLLEGSKNVLVVKKPDSSAYISTITETEYGQQSSMKKRKCSSKTDKINYPKENLRKTSSFKLPATPPPMPSETPPPSFHMSMKNLDCHPSIASSPTLFEEPFSNGFPYRDEAYETPRMCENEYTLEQRCATNTYGSSPTMPPPLPKRNSNISDTPTVDIKRY